ncbi:hypothetical protein [Tellurirhabdus rosea]|uniref:hypothetical protein n=1 Tax=Tellurirhabdus rosea TaxID=2674997 RepID=UPI002251041C|nr:hypothetical protein [Tellurirhabdus rosea]
MKQLFAALLLFTALSATAAPPDGPDTLATLPAAPNVTRTKAMSMAIYPNLDHTKMHLMVENHVEIPLFVTFMDGKNKLYDVKVGKRLRAFHAKFDISQLKDGDYTIEVSDGFNKIVKTFSVGTRPPQKEGPSRFLTAID